jgi:hypothetical protein
MISRALRQRESRRLAPPPLPPGLTIQHNITQYNTMYHGQYVMCTIKYIMCNVLRMQNNILCTIHYVYNKKYHVYRRESSATARGASTSPHALSLSLSLSHSLYTHTHTHARTHARTAHLLPVRAPSPAEAAALLLAAVGQAQPDL